MIKVLVSDPLSEQGIKLLQDSDKYHVDVKLKLPKEELIKIISEYDVLLVRSETKVTSDVIEKTTKLKIIGRAGAGVDNIDIPAASKRGIMVMNTPGGNTVSAAEHTISMLLALSRNIPQANASLKKGEWNRKQFTGTEVLGKTLGVLGLGKIGAEVAKRAKAFGMKILAYDPFTSQEHAQKLGVTLATVDEVISSSDYITLHIPRNAETENLINKTSISKMKDGVRIVNVARGGIVNEADLADAVKSGKVKGAALDVFQTEPCTSSPVFEENRVIVTPHLGASTEEAQINVAIAVVKQVMLFFEKNIVQNAVNVPAVDSEVLKELQPYITLSEKIGSLQSQLVESGIIEAEIQYSGELAEKDISCLTTSFLKGLLQNMEDDVNFVNAPFIAKERGIKIKEVKTSSAADFVNLITVQVKTEKKSCVVSGTLFHKNDIRIVRINDFYIDSVPTGHMLICTNSDTPGVIGKVGTVLGESGINIAAMQVGRKTTGGNALIVTNIDQEVPSTVLENLRKNKDIMSIKSVKL